MVVMNKLHRSGGRAGVNLIYSEFKTGPLQDAAKTAALTATVSWMEKEKRQTVKQTIGSIPFFEIVLGAHCKDKKELNELITRFAKEALAERQVAETSNANDIQLLETAVLKAQQEEALRFVASEGGFK